MYSQSNEAAFNHSNRMSPDSSQSATHQNDESPLILVIDDSAENRQLLRLQLERANYEVLLADNGNNGIALAQTAQPDLILLDVMMPTLNGYDVCSRLKQGETTSHIKIIILSALTDTRSRVQGIRSGADDFLSRPYHTEELLVRIAGHIDLKRAQEKLQAEHAMLELLYNVGKAATAQTALNQMLTNIIVTTKDALVATMGNIMLLDSTGAVTHKILVRDDEEGKVSCHVSHEVMSYGFAGWLTRSGRGDIIIDADDDSRWVVLENDKDKIRSAIGVPLFKSSIMVGLLLLAHPERGYFHSNHLELLTAVGRHVTAAIQNAHLFEQINEQRRRFELILEQSSDVIITISPTHEVTLLNRAAEIVFGVKQQDVLYRPIRQCTKLAIAAEQFENIGDEPFTTELTLKSGVTLYGTFSTVPTLGHLAVLQDITPYKRVEEQRLAQERHEKEQVKRALTRYISPVLLDDVLAEAAGVLERRTRQFAVVLFADLRNSTELVSSMPPNDAIELLNEFFNIMTGVVYEFEGTIFDLIGDELEIAFNAPLPQPDAIERAFEAALAMQAHFHQHVAEWYERSGVMLGLGIGIEMGDVVIGNVGAKTRMHYAIVGRAVNVAHALVDLAEDGQLILSETVAHALRRTSAGLLTSAGAIQHESHRLKGSAEFQTVYRLQPSRETESITLLE